MVSPDATQPVAELIVLNGRQKGNRCPLRFPLTLIGRDPACDVRLNLDGVAPFHVALVQGPAGPVLRDLSGQGELLVNGRGVDNRLLHDGDVLTMGPFQFELSLPPEMGYLPPQGLSEEGLRVQVAAVAAEQVRLTELENRLEQRRVALETQEKQLISHLEDRHGRLETYQQQVKEERQQWRQQRESEEAELARVRTELTLRSEQLDGEERRLAQEAAALQEKTRVALEALNHREAQLTAERQRLEADRPQLTTDRQAVEQIRLRLNTEMELGKRQLRAEWEKLHLEQQRWEVLLHEEEQERRRKARELTEREENLVRRQEAFAAEQHRMRKAQVNAQKELRGLENRVQGQRARLTAMERELTRREPALVGSTALALTTIAPPSPVVSPPAPHELVELAAHLSDQRLHLAEQWQRLVTQQQEWEADRAALLTNLEETTTSLVRRETELLERSEVAERRESILDQRQARLEALELRLRIQQADQTIEQSRILAEVAGREQASQDLVNQARDQVQAERRRSRKAIRRLVRAGEQFEKLHAECSRLWQEHQDERRERVLTQQEIARQRLALEKMRHEILARAVNVAVAERKLDRLEKECAALWVREETDLKAEWQSLDRERGLLNQLARESLVELADRLQEVCLRMAKGQQRRDRAAERGRRRIEQQTRWQQLEADRARAERQVELLRAELDRVAMNLMGEGEPEESSAENQAA